MTEPTLLAIDQGTTGTTVLVLDRRATVLGRATVPVPQHFPGPGEVEHDLDEIWSGVGEAIGLALADAKLAPRSVHAIGITNQRETTALWRRRDGAAVHRAIVWQDRRTAPLCAELKSRGLEPRVQARTGLLLDPYFSGTKLAWLLANVDGARASARAGDLAFGTIDCWLVNKLTGGVEHVTDATNASRTMLMDLATLAWDDEMLAMLDVPRRLLPRIAGNAEILGRTRGVHGLPDGIPIAGMAGDQQAALFGQGCVARGDVKCTYGTGAFALMNVGDAPVHSTQRLLATVAWRIGAKTTYALEGSAFIAGAAVQWLRDGLKLFAHASDVEALARSVADSGEVVFVPALTGLGAPHWAPHARGTISGIGRDTTAAHIARATLEGIALSIADLVDAMRRDAHLDVASLRVDGGASANDLLMELQSALIGARVVRPRVVETTALGAGMLAALGSGLIESPEAVARALPIERVFAPDEIAIETGALRARWHTALARVLHDPETAAPTGQNAIR